MVKNERNRYIFFRIISNEKGLFNSQEVISSIWRSIWRYFGMKEANKIGLWLIEFDKISGYGLLRCSHHTKEILVSSLALITDISGSKAIVSPIKTSGTIKSIKNFESKIKQKYL